MGTKSSKTVEGGILLELEKPYYYPGELIVGKIYLNFQQNFASDGIYLTLEGEEFVSFKQRKTRKSQRNINYENNTNNNQTKSYIKTRTGKKIIYKQEQLIIPFRDSMIYSGQYIYPFSFMLNPSLPGSFEYYDEQNSAYIKYILDVKVQSKVSDHNIKNEMLLIVRQPPQFFQYPKRLSDTKNISTWCCFDKGSSTLNISYEKNFYCPDEKVNVICELDNTRCQLKSNSIKLALIQTIILKDKENKSRSNFLCRTIAESRYDGHYVY